MKDKDIPKSGPIRNPVRRNSHLSNVPASYRHFIEQAAANTGFKILVDNDCRDFFNKPYKSNSHVSVWSFEGDRDHTPFWTEYDRLKAEASKVKR